MHNQIKQQILEELYFTGLFCCACFTHIVCPIYAICQAIITTQTKSEIDFFLALGAALVFRLSGPLYEYCYNKY